MRVKTLSVSHYHTAVARTGRGRRPSTGNAAFEQLICRWRVIHQSDRPDRADSIGIENEKDFL